MTRQTRRYAVEVAKGAVQATLGLGIWLAWCIDPAGYLVSVLAGCAIALLWWMTENEVR